MARTSRPRTPASTSSRACPARARSSGSALPEASGSARLPVAAVEIHVDRPDRLEAKLGEDRRRVLACLDEQDRHVAPHDLVPARADEGSEGAVAPGGAEGRGAPEVRQAI